MLGANSPCYCPCKHRPLCYLCRRDHHYYSAPGSLARAVPLQPAPYRQRLEGRRPA